MQHATLAMHCVSASVAGCAGSAGGTSILQGTSQTEPAGDASALSHASLRTSTVYVDGQSGVVCTEVGPCWWWCLLLCTLFSPGLHGHAVNIGQVSSAATYCHISESCLAAAYATSCCTCNQSLAWHYWVWCNSTLCLAGTTLHPYVQQQTRLVVALASPLQDPSVYT